MSSVLGKVASRILRTYYRGPNHPMKLRLWWGLRKFLGFPRLTIPYAGSGWITVDERDLLQGIIFVTGSYEPEVWETLATFITSNEVVWDIGAHIGSFAIRAMLDLRVKEIHAFEPNPNLADILQMNLSLNKVNKIQYTVHPFALSNQRETRKIYHGPLANTGLSSLCKQTDCEVSESDCRTCDELVFQEGFSPPTVIKIDTEGWEFRVLKGAKRVLKEFSPKAIVFETECDESGKIISHSLTSYLEEIGYQLQHIRRPCGTVEPRENFIAIYRL